MVKQYGALYLDTRRALLETEEPDMAGFMARSLICHVSGKNPDLFLADRDLYATEEVCRAVDAGLRRLKQGEPLAYVLGEWDFYGLNLTVSPDVLIPRDDTCAVTSLAIQQALFLNQDPRVLDLCCVGLAIASRVKDARVTLADLSPEALTVAKRNMMQTKLSARVRCVQVNALEPAPAFLGKFDLIVSNPPYITAEEMEALPISVRNYEPHMALYGGEDGLDFYRSIAKNFSRALKPGGFLCFEFGMGQGDAVCRILEDNDYAVLERVRDYNDRERAVLAQYGRTED